MALRSTLFTPGNYDIPTFLNNLTKLPRNDLATLCENLPLGRLAAFTQKDKDGTFFKGLILFLRPEDRLAFLKYVAIFIEKHPSDEWKNKLEWILRHLPLAHRSLFLEAFSPKGLGNLLKMRQHEREEYHKHIVRVLLLLEPNPIHDAVMAIFANNAGKFEDNTEEKFQRILALKLNLTSLAWLLRLLPFNKGTIDQFDTTTLQALIVSPEQLNSILRQTGYKEAPLLILRKLGEAFVIKLLPRWEECKIVLECSEAKSALIHFLPIRYFISIQPDYRVLHATFYQHHGDFLTQVVAAVGAKRLGESIHSFDDLCSYLQVLEDDMARAVVANVCARGLALLPKTLPDFNSLLWPSSQQAAWEYTSKLILVLKQVSPRQLDAYCLTQSCLMQLSAENLARVLPAINCAKQRKALQEAHAERWLQQVTSLPIDQEEDLFRGAYLNDFSFSELQTIAVTNPTWHLHELCCRLEKIRLSNIVKRGAGEMDMPTFFRGLLKMQEDNLTYAERFIRACLKALKPYPLKPMTLTELGKLMRLLPPPMQTKLVMQLDFTKLIINADEVDLFLLTLASSLRLDFISKMIERLEVKTGEQLVNIKCCLPKEQQATFLKLYQTVFCLLHQKMSVEEFAKKAATFQDGGLELAEFRKGITDEHARYHQLPSSTRKN